MNMGRVGEGDIVNGEIKEQLHKRRRHRTLQHWIVRFLGGFIHFKELPHFLECDFVWIAANTFGQLR